jgi:PAS domain S-box-containing protein
MENLHTEQETSSIPTTITELSSNPSQMDAELALKESEQRLRSIVENTPFPIGVYVGKEMRIQLVNDAIVKVWGKEGNVVGKLYSEVLPELQGSGIYEQLDQVFTTGIPFHAKYQRVDLVVDGRLQPFYFNYSFTPLFTTTGEIYGVMNTAAEVTDIMVATKKLEESEHRFRNTVLQAPVGMCILKGKDFIVELANSTYLEVVDKTEEQFIGKSLFESLPEVRNVIEPLLANVMETGKPYYGNEFMVYLNRHGSKDAAYFNFVYQPLHEIDGTISGIIVVANEVTEIVESKHAIAENAKQFKEFITQSPVAMVIFRGPDLIIESPNNALLEGVWQKELHEVEHKKLLDVFPELKEQHYPKLLEAVFKTGIPYTEKETIAFVEGNQGMKKYYLDVQYAPLFENNGDVSGIMVTVNDVTDKVEARQRIEESEQRLILANEAAQMGTFDWDLATGTFLQSDKLAQIFGFENNSNITHQDLLNLFHPDDKPIRDKAVEESLADGSLIYEARIIWKDKSTHWIKVYGKVIYNEQKEAQRMYGTVMDITEAKKSLIALEESESKLNIAIDATELGTFDINLQKEEMTYSSKYLEIYGFRPTDKPSRKDVIARVHPDDIESRAIAMENAIQTGVLDHETRILHNDGSLHWIRVRGKLVTDKHNQPERILGTVRDITHEKNATQQLQENEERLNIAIESAELGTWELNLKTKQPTVSVKYLEILGYGKDENPPHAELLTKIHPDDIAFRNQQVEQALISGKLDYEMRVIPSEGIIRWIRSRGKVFYDKHGVPEKMLGTIMDITDQKNALLDLEKNEKLLEEKVAERTAELQLSKEMNFRMVNEVEDYAILLLNKDGLIQNWNKGAEKIKGYTSGEIINNSLQIFYTEKDRDEGLPKKLLNEARNTGRASNEGWRVRKDGSRFWANVVITALHNENNEVIGFSKFTRDLTAKKMAEQELEHKSAELQKANISLEKSNSELEQFAYIASHDLQEPLRKIQFFVEQLQKAVPDLSQSSILYFDKIRNSTTRMNTLINDLLDFSRLSQSSENYVPVDLNAVITHINNDFELLIQQKQASITVATLPTIQAVPLQMQQLFYNMISNALKFSKENQPCLIAINCEKLSNKELAAQYPQLDKELSYHLITIKDNGIGFDQQYAEKIFVIFQRLNGLHAYGGTGIGLALCKKIVLNHRGEIFAKSKEDEGSTFSIILPEKQVTN